MKIVELLTITLLPLFILMGCIKPTTRGGDNSVTNNNYNYDYQFSNKTKFEIDSSIKTIVMTETLDDNYIYSSDMIAAYKTSFIESVKNEMENLGYKLISTDSENIGEENRRFLITLVFEHE